MGMSLFDHDPGLARTTSENFLRRKDMSSDDLTHDLTEGSENDKTTQATITAVFRLLQDLDKRLNGRLDNLENRFDGIETRIGAIESRIIAIDNRLDALDSRLDRDFASVDARFESIDARFESVDARFAEMSDQMKAEFLRLSD